MTLYFAAAPYWPRISLYISLTEYILEYQLTLADAVAIPFDMRFFPVFRALGPKNPGRWGVLQVLVKIIGFLTIKDAQIKPGKCVLTKIFPGEVDLLIYFASEIYKQKPAKAGFWVLSSSPYCTRLNRPAWRVRIFNAHALQSRNYRQNAYILPYKYL